MTTDKKGISANTLLPIVLMTVLAVTIGYGEENEKQFRRPCVRKDIEKYLIDVDYSFYSLRDFMAWVDELDCTIDTSSIQKILLQILSSEKLGVERSPKQKVIYSNSWRVILDDVLWCDATEKEIDRRRLWYKEREVSKYYRYTWILVERSPNWFRYAMEVYSINDTNHFSDRTAVYRAVMERFKNGGNPAEMNKVESLLYAVLENEKLTIIGEIDTYLKSKSERYRKSSQRKEMAEARIKYYEQKKIQTGFDYRAMLDDLNSIIDDMKEVKTLTDYTPPLVIE